MHVTGGRSLQQESGSWQACVIYCDCMIYLALAGRGGGTLGVFSFLSPSFLQPSVKTAESRAECERSINGLLILSSYISSLCYFKPSLRFMCRALALLLFFSFSLLKTHTRSDFRVYFSRWVETDVSQQVRLPPDLDGRKKKNTSIVRS